MTDTAIFKLRMTGTDTIISASANSTLLNAAEQAGVRDLKLESSCRNGTCRTCMCLMLAGEVTYLIDWPGLSLDEKREGWILPCVAYPRTDVVLQLPG
jgi:ferredoxin